MSYCLKPTDYKEETVIHTYREASSLLRGDDKLRIIKSLRFDGDYCIDDSYVRSLCLLTHLTYVERFDFRGNDNVTNKSIKYILQSRSVGKNLFRWSIDGLSMNSVTIKVTVKETGIDVDSFYNEGDRLRNYLTKSERKAIRDGKQSP